MRRILPKWESGGRAERILQVALDDDAMREIWKRRVRRQGECWVWVGAWVESESVGSQGLGVGKNGITSSVPPHVLHFTWFHGRLPERTLNRTCGNPRCIVHWAETGWSGCQIPTNHKSARALSMCHAETIRQIYEPFNRTCGARALARRYGVSVQTISEIVHYETYASGGAVCGRME